MHFRVTAVLLASMALTEAQPFIQRRYGNDTKPAIDSTLVASETTSSTSSLVASSTIGEATATSTSPVLISSTTSDNSSSASTTTNSNSISFTSSSSLGTAISSFSLPPNLTQAYGSATSSITEISPGVTDSPNTSGLVGETATSVITSTAVDVSTTVSDKTLTFTQGVEGSSTIITTTIHVTQLLTVTKTTYATVTGSKPAGAFYGAASSSVIDANTGVGTTSPVNAIGTAVTSEPTTIVIRTSTLTETITLVPASKTGGAGAGATSATSAIGVDATSGSAVVTGGSNNGNGPDFGSETGQCAMSVVTVTTVVRSTVTVAPSLASATSTVSSDKISNAPLEVMPSYGSNNGTDASKSRVASSGFLTMPKAFAAIPTNGL